MNKKILIIILVFLNAILIIKNYNDLNLLQKKSIKYNSLFLKFHENYDKRSIYNPSTHKYKVIKVHEVFNKRQNYHLVAFLDDKSCIECVQKETHFLNKFYNKFPFNLDVYFIGDDKTLLDKLGAEFPFIVKSECPKIFKENIKDAWSTPFILFVSPDNIVLDIHKIETGVSIKSKVFYSNIFNLLRDLQ